MADQQTPAPASKTWVALAAVVAAVLAGFAATKVRPQGRRWI